MCKNTCENGFLLCYHMQTWKLHDKAMMQDYA
jgi:hypothetical protein